MGFAGGLPPQLGPGGGGVGTVRRRRRLDGVGDGGGEGGAAPSVPEHTDERA